MTYLYIVTLNGDELPCKVGISENPDARLASLQCGSHIKLALRETYWVDNRERATRIERQFQDEHVEWRMNSEWFGMTFEEVNRWLFNKIDWPDIQIWRAANP